MKQDINKSLGNKVRCPNMCQNGYVKYYPDSTKALFETTKCVYCKGSGEVLASMVEKIERSI